MNVQPWQISSGFHMKDLGKKEFLARLISSLEAHEFKKGNLLNALKYNDLQIEIAPDFLPTIANRGAIIHEIGKDYATNLLEGNAKVEVTPSQIKKMRWYRKAIKRGWQPPDWKKIKAQEKVYLQRIKDERAKNQMTTEIRKEK